MEEVGARYNRKGAEIKRPLTGEGKRAAVGVIFIRLNTELWMWILWATSIFLAGYPFAILADKQTKQIVLSSLCGYTPSSVNLRSQTWYSMNRYRQGVSHAWLRRRLNFHVFDELSVIGLMAKMR